MGKPLKRLLDGAATGLSSFDVLLTVHVSIILDRSIKFWYFADRASQYNLSNYPTWCTNSCFI